jgi:hypothetical protein
VPFTNTDRGIPLGYTPIYDSFEALRMYIPETDKIEIPGIFTLKPLIMPSARR